MELLFPIAFFALWLGILGFILFRFATLGFRGAGLGAKVTRELVSFRTESSTLVKTELSVVETRRREAPIAIAFVQRTPLSIAASGASFTPDQARAVAAWLREAAAAARR